MRWSNDMSRPRSLPHRGPVAKGERTLMGAAHVAIGVLLASIVLATFSGCDWIRDQFRGKAPDVKFAPYGKEYQSKMDFAQLEYKYPLATEELAPDSALDTVVWPSPDRPVCSSGPDAGDPVRPRRAGPRRPG